MKRIETLNFKFIIFIIIIVLIIITNFYFILENKNKDTRIMFLKSYGDIKVVENMDNSMSLGLIIYDYDYTYNQNQVKVQNLKFENNDIKILDYDFVDSGLKYKNAKLFYLNITYNLNKNNLDYINNSVFEINNIYIGDKNFEIGNLFFFPVPNNYNEIEDLNIESVSAMSPGIGLKKFFANLNNNTSDNISIQSIDLKHFNNFKAIFTLNNNNKISQSYSANDFEIKDNSEALLNIEFNHIPDEYDVFYFTPILKYFDSQNKLQNLYFDYLVSGLMLDKEDLKIIINKYDELYN